jgi:hypothetical protein
LHFCKSEYSVNQNFLLGGRSTRQAPNKISKTTPCKGSVKPVFGALAALCSGQEKKKATTRSHLLTRRDFVIGRWNLFLSGRLAAIGQEISAVSDDTPMPPFVYDGLDPVPEPKSAIADVTDAVKGAAHRVSDAIETGRRPGMPLSILSNIAREAPLGSLLVAFLLGVAVARRR